MMALHALCTVSSVSVDASLSAATSPSVAVGSVQVSNVSASV
jgi:hypothetical protein